MHSTLAAMSTPCLITEDKKFFTPSIQLHKSLLQNPAYQVAIPALLELHSGRSFTHNSENKSIKMEVSPPKTRSESFPESVVDFKMDSIPHTTLLNYHPITAFSVGGELRLCLPQVMNSVLKNYSLQQIEHKINELNIYISRCSNEQAKCLKLIKVLPDRVPYCGLITKSNAERLVHELLDKENESSSGHVDSAKKLKLSSEVSAKLFGFRVYHECFGKCKGTLYPTLFTEPEAKCIECLECKFIFAPNKFVCHAHRGHESIGICHWGFDSANWRSYIQISKDQENCKELDGHLDQMKGKVFDHHNISAGAGSDTHQSAMGGVIKRKLDPDSSDKLLITPIISSHANSNQQSTAISGNNSTVSAAHHPHGTTPKKKFPRVDCDSGFGSSPDSSSNRSPSSSPPPVLTSSSATALSAPRLATSCSSASSMANSIPVHVSNHSQTTQLANAIKNNPDLYSQIFTSSAAGLNNLSAGLGSFSLAPGLQKQQQGVNSQAMHSPRSHSTPYAVIKPSDKVAAALLTSQLTFPNGTTINTQQDLQRHLIAIEANKGAGNVSPGASSALQNSQFKHPPTPSAIQHASSQSNNVHNSGSLQTSPAGGGHIGSAPSVIIPPHLSPHQGHVTALGLVHGVPNVVAGTVGSAVSTDLVSPELRMISQAMEVTIAKINAHCTPNVKLHLDQLVELLKEQQKQYLKDFAMTHQENERLSMELKIREKELSEAKNALSKVRNDLQHSDIELHNEKTLRFRNQIDLAQVLRNQQALGTYNSVIFQQQHKLQQSSILQSDAILAAKGNITSSSPAVTSICYDVITSACSKAEPDWSSLSPASVNSVGTPTPSPKVEASTECPRTSPRCESEERTPTNGSPFSNHLPNSSKTEAKTGRNSLQTNREEIENDAETRTRSPPPTRDDDESTRGTPSPSHSTESSSQLLIVDC